MNNDKYFMEFLEALICLIQANREFLLGREFMNTELTVKYIDELKKIQDVINEFEFVSGKSKTTSVK